MATSDSGSVFFPPGVCRMKFRRGMLGMWQWLYVQSQTINQKSLSSLKWKQCPDPRWQFCFAGLCEQCVATGYPSASSWQGSEDGECHCNSTKKRKQVSAGGNVIFMTPKLSPPRHKNREVHNEISVGGRKLESWAAQLPYSPVCTEHSCFVITKEALNITRGYLSSSSPWGGIRRQ